MADTRNTVCTAENSSPVLMSVSDEQGTPLSDKCTGNNSSWLHVKTPSTSGRCFWDLGLGTPPTPMASSTLAIGAAPRHTTLRDSAQLGPIPLSYDCDIELEALLSNTVPKTADYPTTPPNDHSGNNGVCAVTTPLGHSLRSLNISQNQTPCHSAFERRAVIKSVDGSHRIKMLSANERRAGAVQRRPLHRPSAHLSGPQWNINPFTFVMTHVGCSPVNVGKRTELCSAGQSCDSSELSSMMEVFDDSGIEKSAQKLSLRQINTSRFDEEFHVINKIGSGQYGEVFRCVNRIDGCVYAVKKSKFRVAGTANERNALNEVYAHAILGKHPNVIGYYSAWAEDDRIYIQTEYCNGGNLEALLTNNSFDGDKRRSLGELELKQLMVHIASGLKYIHSVGLVHLDIKPENIFIQHQCASHTSVSLSCDGSMDEGLGDDCVEELDSIVYKIGDMGQITSAHVTAQSNIDEGDCRYLPCELLADMFTDLPKADIFSLALTVYEAATGQRLPGNGPEWHSLRHQGLQDIPTVNREFNLLLKSMAAYDMKQRPTAQLVMQSPVLSPYNQKSSSQLRRELADERLKCETLGRELKLAKQTIKQLKQMSDQCHGHSSRAVGKSCGRSQSLVL